MAKRVYVNDALTQEMVNRLFKYFQTKVYIPRVKRGKRQEIETLINEEGFLIGRYLRVKDAGWLPRVAVP